jgi:hypothetical protein
MIDRCCNPKSASYKDYGARGIGVCAEWRWSFAEFFMDMGERPSPDHSIDRVDNDWGYEPNNCRWATSSEQMRNTRRAYYYKLRGFREWVEDNGLEDQPAAAIYVWW